MAGRKRIGVLVHEKQIYYEALNYMLWALREEWRRQGIEVIVQRGIARDFDADLVIPHLDMTAWPEEYQEFLARHPAVLNRRVTDLSKRKLSRKLVGPDDDYEGPVIVKTDANAGGRPDLRLRLGGRPRRSRPWHRLRDRLRGRPPRRPGAPPLPDPPTALETADWLDPHDYPVFDSIAEVPCGVFDNPALVVEQFLPEREGDLYCIRTYAFLGDRHTCRRRTSHRASVKSLHMVDARENIPVHEEMVTERERLGVEFGKFDYVVHEGEAVLLDVATTPVFTGNRMTKSTLRRAAHLAQGIHSLWPAAVR